MRLRGFLMLIAALAAVALPALAATQAQADYRQGVEIAEQRNPALYPQAARLLERAAAHAPADSRVSLDAKAYLEWLDADLRFRLARRASQVGENHLALALLDQASACEVLDLQGRQALQATRRAILAGGLPRPSALDRDDLVACLSGERRPLGATLAFTHPDQPSRLMFLDAQTALTHSPGALLELLAHPTPETPTELDPFSEEAIEKEWEVALAAHHADQE